MDLLEEATVLTTLDNNSANSQFRVEDSNKDKIAFTSRHGSYRFNKMSFEIYKVPGTFQRPIDFTLSVVKLQFALSYLDDILIFSMTLE